MSSKHRHRFGYRDRARMALQVRALEGKDARVQAVPQWNVGVADDAPGQDFEKSPQLLRDLKGVVHMVVKDEMDGFWKYCDIEVMRDWLTQDGKNLVPEGTSVTCLKCLNEDFEK